ncbi:MAG TPA: hypothetical protein VGO62_06005, partial [Myxococcota bacterium]
MGFFDKVKKFAGGKNTATVEILAVNDAPLEDAMVQISDTVTTGKMRVTAQQDCVMIAMKADVILRTENDQGQWGDIVVATQKTTERRAMKTGETFEHSFVVNGVDLETYLRNQSYDDMAAVPTNPKVKFIVRCIADVEGSPFDPQAEADVLVGESTAGPCKVETTVVEGQPAAQATFAVTDSVCKGTVVVTAKAPCTLLATRYELWLELNTPQGLSEVLVARDQHPEIKKEGLLGISVSFGGTNITFPHRMKAGDKATQTWSIGDVNNAAKLAAGG